MAGVVTCGSYLVAVGVVHIGLVHGALVVVSGLTLFHGLSSVVDTSRVVVVVHGRIVVVQGKGVVAGGQGGRVGYWGTVRGGGVLRQGGSSVVVWDSCWARVAGRKSKRREVATILISGESKNVTQIRKRDSGMRCKSSSALHQNKRYVEQFPMRRGS